jgi:hypothetical protein
MFKYLFLLACFLEIVFSQLTDYIVGTEIEESVDGNKYYQIALDQDTLSQNNTLVIYVKPSDNYEGFSDPDLYASVKNYYPNTFYNAEWRSTSLGRDIITIPSSELSNSTSVYIGVVCTKQCKYVFKAEYQKEIELHLNTAGFINFGNETDKVLRYYQQPGSKVVEFYSMGTQSSDYKVKISYVIGDSMNHDIPAYTTWIGGYSALIDTDLYPTCPKCYVKFVITTKPFSAVMFGLRDANVTKPLKVNDNVFGSILNDMMDCYLFNETRAEGQSNNFIFYANSYRNYVNLTLRAGDTRPESIKANYGFNYALTTKFTYEELQGNYLCLSADPHTPNFNSYIFTLFREDSIEEIGEFTLYSGVQQQGYQLGGKAVTYALPTNTIDSFKSMSMNLKVSKGNPIMYGYFCTEEECRFSGQTIKNEVNLIQTSKVNQEYSLQVTPEMNKCSTRPENCHAMMIVYCEGTEECEYHVTMTIQKGELQLAERTKSTKMIERGLVDNYVIKVEDSNVDILTIILHSHVGDADLIVSRVNRKPEEDPDHKASSSSGNRDIVQFKKSDNESLSGEYYIAVSAYAFSYYSLYYYTTLPNVEVETYEMSLGSVYTDTVNKTDKKIYSFISDAEKQTPHIMVMSSINCDVTFQRMDNTHATTGLMKQDRTSQELRTKHEIITPDFRYSYAINTIDSSADNTSNDCILHLSANIKGDELLLNENIAHQVTLGEQIDSFYYVYPHVSSEDGFVLSMYYDKGTNYNLNVLVSFKDKVTKATPERDVAYKMTLYQTNQDHIYIEKNTLNANCPVYPCFIHIHVGIEKRNPEKPVQDLTYRILATSLNKKPIYVSADKVVEGSQPSGIYQYYYTDLAKGQSGEVGVRTPSGTIKAYAKIIAKDAPSEPNADYNNVRLPNQEFHQIKMDNDKGVIKFTEAHTAKCENGCSIYIAVLTDKYESFNDYLISYSITVRLSAVQLKLGREHSGILTDTTVTNYYTVDIDKDTDEIVIYTEHTNHIELLVNLGSKLPTEDEKDWEIKFYSRETQPNYREKFVIKVTDEKFTSKSITNLNGETFTIALRSMIPGDNLYSLFVVTKDSQVGKKDPLILPYGSYTPCSTSKDDSFCLYVIDKIENEDNLLLFARQNKHHNTGIKLSLYASVVQKSDFHNENYPTELKNFKFNSIGLVNTEYLVINGSELTDYKNKVIVIALHSTKQTSLTLFSSLHQMSSNILHTPIAGKPYLVFLEKMKGSAFQFSSNNYMVDIERVQGEGTFSLAGNTEYNFNISRHRPQYRLVLNSSDKVQFNTQESVAFFLTYKTKDDFFGIHIGKSYHFVILGANFPMDFRFPLLQEYTNDNIFNLQVEKAISQDPNGKDLLLNMSYDEIGTVANKTWTSDFSKATQSGSLVFNNQMDQFDLADDRLLNRTGLIKINEVTDMPIKYDLLIFNIVLFPQNDGYTSLPKNQYINGKIITDKLAKDDYYNQHVYKLSRDHNKEKFILLEISSCMGEVDFYIGEYVDMKARNATKHDYKTYDSYGKMIIELNLNNDDADAFLIVYAKKPALVDGKYTSSYVVRYNSYTDSGQYDTYNLAGQSQVVYVENDDNFELKWGSVTGKDENNNDILMRSKYLVKLIKANDFVTNMSSICYTYGIDKYFTQRSSSTRDNDRLLLSKSDMTAGEEYFVSIVATTDESSDHTLLAYNPIQLKYSSNLTGLPLWAIVSLTIVSFCLVLVIICLYRKYTSTKLRLDFEINDVRNMGSINRSENEMKNIQAMRAQEKYLNLHETNPKMMVV